MQGKSLYAILLSIIAVLALALAVLVIFLLTTYNNIKPVEQPDPTEEAREVVPDEERGKFVLFTDSGGAPQDAVFNLKPSPAHSDSYAMVNVTIVYDMGTDKDPEGKRLKLFSETYLSELRQACIQYFRSQTYEDLIEESALDKASDTLKDKFNVILEGKSKDKIVLKIIFDKMILQ